MEDHCVYARNLLGRLTSIYGTSATPTYSQSQTPQGVFANPGSLIMIAAIVLLVFMSFRNRRKAPESKLQ